MLHCNVCLVCSALTCLLSPLMRDRAGDVGWWFQLSWHPLPLHKCDVLDERPAGSFRGDFPPQGECARGTSMLFAIGSLRSLSCCLFMLFLQGLFIEDGGDISSELWNSFKSQHSAETFGLVSKSLLLHPKNNHPE